MLVTNDYGIWQIDLTIDGKRVRKTTKTKDKALAQKLHALTEAEMLKGNWGLTKEKYTLDQAFRHNIIHKWKDAKSKYKVEQNWELLTGGTKPLLDKTKDVSSVTPAVIEEIKSGLRLQGNSNATINRKMAVLRRLLNLCEIAGKLTKAPRITLETEDKDGRHRVLTDEEEVSMMRFFREQYPEQAGLFEFLLSSANRVSECLKLTWFDVDFKNGKVILRKTKSGKDIVKPMTTVMRTVLENRKGLTRPFPYTLDMVESYWKLMRKSLGLQDDKTFVIHCLRHTCATRLVIAGVPLLRVQQWLGHTSYAMTQRYAKLSPEHMNDVASALNDAKDFDHTLSYGSQSQYSSKLVGNH